VILPAGGHDHMGCFTDQVKLTRALVRNLDEAIKEVKLLGEHEESSQKITELKALCKKLRENTQRLEEEEEEDADDGGDATAPPCSCTTTSSAPCYRA
jgi:hypothetical protein